MAMPAQHEKAPRNPKSRGSDDSLSSAGQPPQVGNYGSPPVFDTAESGIEMKARNPEPTYVSAHPHKDLRPRGVKENESPADSLLDLYEGPREDRPKGPLKRTTGETIGSDSVGEDDDSKWIHRDKLARIENEELQAAGIFLPRPRERDRDRESLRSKSQNRSKRDRSQEPGTGQPRAVSGPEHATSRSRKNSAAPTFDPKTPEGPPTPSWDLRLPEEIEEEGDGYWVSVGGRASKIPVAKASPVPIPPEQLERDRLLMRTRDSSPGDEESISYPKPRARSGSTGNILSKTATNGTLSQPTLQPNKPSSPKKTTSLSGSRKPSAGRPNGAAGRPKTRGGPSKDSTSSGGGTRPSTRSGERELSMGSSKQMEGEPPWMISAYRPDPRLPPDQQLLPTVAKRLQQEKWEREGKFGNVYDKEFRPLTDEGFSKPPEPRPAQENDEEQRQNEKGEHDERNNAGGDWPLRAEATHKPARSSSYSTMPKISDKTTMGSLPSPRPPSRQAPPTAVIRVQDSPEDPQKKGGCGCCIIM